MSHISFPKIDICYINVYIYCMFIREGLGDISLSDTRRLIESCLFACYDAIGPRKELTSEIVSREFERVRVEPHAR